MSEPRLVYCLGTAMQPCDACQHRKSWETLNQLPDTLRRQMQEGATSVSTDRCMITHWSLRKEAA